VESRRLFVAALLSMLVLLLWRFAFPPQPPVAPPLEESAVAAAEAGAVEPAPVPAHEPEAELSEAGAAGTAPAPAPERPLLVAEAPRPVTIETPGYTATVDNRGAALVSVHLAPREGAGGAGVELLRRRGADAEPRTFSFVGLDGAPLPIDRELFVVDHEEGSREVVLRYSGPLGEAEKRFVFGDDLVEFAATWDGAAEEWGLLVGPGLRNPTLDELEDRYRKGERRVSYGAGSELGAREVAGLEEVLELPAGSRWLALEDKYFVAVLAPTAPLATVRAIPALRVDEAEGGSFELVSGTVPESDEDRSRDAALVLDPGGTTVAGTAYLGAKEYLELRRLVRAGELPRGVQQTVRWGWFGWVSKPLLFGLHWLYGNVVRNYGWCIVLMTVLIKILLFPLTHKSYVSMQKMQKLNPKMEAIRQRHRGKLRDKQGRPNLEAQRRMNEEMQQLFREEGVSPAGGCLPILAQMPIFFGFYGLLANAVELWNQPWIGWIQDLTVRDPYYVLPIVMGLTQLASTKMMPPPTNPSQRILITTMPIWFTIFSLGFPSGLVLYWLTNNVLTIIQQGGYNRLKKAGFLGGTTEAPAGSKGGGPPSRQQRVEKAEGREA
jgi:YidC/Oxa1 family membrane protein insertase